MVVYYYKGDGRWRGWSFYKGSTVQYPNNLIILLLSRVASPLTSTEKHHVGDVFRLLHLPFVELDPRYCEVGKQCNEISSSPQYLPINLASACRRLEILKEYDTYKAIDLAYSSPVDVLKF